MVDLTIPLAGGILIVIARAFKNLLKKRGWLEEASRHVFSDVAAGGLVLVGINSVIFSLINVQFFNLEASDVKNLLTISGLFFIFEGSRRIKRMLEDA